MRFRASANGHVRTESDFASTTISGQTIGEAKGIVWALARVHSIEESTLRRDFEAGQKKRRRRYRIETEGIRDAGERVHPALRKPVPSKSKKPGSSSGALSRKFASHSKSKRDLSRAEPIRSLTSRNTRRVPVRPGATSRYHLTRILRLRASPSVFSECEQKSGVS